MSTKKSVISQELAVEELRNYLSNFVDGEIEVEKNYKNCLNALIDGRLVFSEDLIPTYQLLNPINKDTDFHTSEIKFKTRILPTMTAKLAKGVDLKEDAIRYSLVVTAHIIGFGSIFELDKLSKKDYSLVQELAMVFI